MRLSGNYFHRAAHIHGYAENCLTRNLRAQHVVHTRGHPQGVPLRGDLGGTGRLKGAVGGIVRVKLGASYCMVGEWEGR